MVSKFWENRVTVHFVKKTYSLQKNSYIAFQSAEEVAQRNDTAAFTKGWEQTE